MPLSFMTSAVFNQNPSRAKREADQGPLVITEHGERAYVLLRYEEFKAGQKTSMSLYDALRDPLAGPKDFEPERVTFAGRDVEF